MILENAENFVGAECFRRRSEPHLARSCMDQVVRGKRLDECSLTVTTGAEDRTLNRIRIAAPDDHINGSVLARILPRRRASGYSARHLSQSFFLVGRRQRPD